MRLHWYETLSRLWICTVTATEFREGEFSTCDMRIVNNSVWHADTGVWLHDDDYNFLYKSQANTTLSKLLPAGSLTNDQKWVDTLHYNIASRVVPQQERWFTFGRTINFIPKPSAYLGYRSTLGVDIRTQRQIMHTREWMLWYVDPLLSTDREVNRFTRRVHAQQ